MNYAGFWKRYVARLIDGLIFSPLVFLNYFFIRPDNGVLFSVLTIIVNILALIYSVLFVFYKGQTIGKKAMNLKVVKTDGSKVTLLNSFLREIFTVTNSLLFLIQSTEAEIRPLSIFYGAFAFFTAIEPLAYFLNYRCKAIHDYIGDTIVIEETKKRRRHSS